MREEDPVKTFTLKASEIRKKWFVVDATDAVLGRLASFLAFRLRGKHKPEFCPHMDCGDNFIIINADKVRLTGNKLNDKVFYWHTGFPGGIKQRTARETIDGKFPERLLQKAVQRMITRESPLGRQQMRNLFVYAGSEHPHEAQKPEMIDFNTLHPSNARTGK